MKLVLNEAETVGKDAGLVAEGLLPDGVSGHVIEAPGGTGVIDKGLAGGVGGLQDDVADAAGALLWKRQVLHLIFHFSLILFSLWHEYADIVLAVHALVREVEGFGVGDEAFLII